MAIKGLHVVKKRMAKGGDRYYYYAYRGGPKFWATDQIRIDGPGKRLPRDLLRPINEPSRMNAYRPRGPSPTLFASTVSAQQDSKK